MELVEKIKNKRCKIGVIGIGYVGLPLCVAFAKNGFYVVGIDTDIKKVEKANNGISYIVDVKDKDIKEIIENRKFKASCDFSLLRECDVIIICVPTPLTKTKEPDISHLKLAAEKILENIAPGKLVVVESTTYPGTTKEEILPILEKTGLKVGKDFYLAYSPERVDPANKNWTVENTPRVVGGTTRKCQKVATLLYKQIVEKVIPVSSCEAAEMTKIFENVFRSVNIALVNELAMLCNIMRISVWEVIEAASTKPYGFMKFTPGPGLGGHCIPVDPFYLSWKAREYNFITRFIELSGEINENMPNYVVYRIRMLLNDRGMPLNNSRILILGVAYKKDVNDERESPSLKIIRLLKKNKANVFYNDPYIKEIEVAGKKYFSKRISEKLLKSSDCVVIITDHSVYDWDFIVKNSKLIFDTRGALLKYKDRNIERL